MGSVDRDSSLEVVWELSFPGLGAVVAPDPNLLALWTNARRDSFVREGAERRGKKTEKGFKRGERGRDGCFPWFESIFLLWATRAISWCRPLVRSCSGCRDPTKCSFCQSGPSFSPCHFSRHGPLFVSGCGNDRYNDQLVLRHHHRPRGLQ